MTGASPAPVPLDPRRVRVGISPIGWTNDDRPSLGGEIPLETCLRDMTEAGYAGCELGGKFPREPDALRRALGAFDLALASGWISLYFTEPERRDETLAAFDRHLALLAELGAEVVVVCECGHGVQLLDVPVLEDRPVFDDVQFERLVDGLHEIGARARAARRHVVYHHHMGTGIQNEEEVDRLLSLTDPDRVSLLVDTGHAQFAGFSADRLLERHGERVRHVHLKDVRHSVLERVAAEGASFLDAVEQGVFTVPGDGDIDFRDTLRRLSEIDYRGWLIVEAEQDPAMSPPRAAAMSARDYLRRLVGL